MLSSFTTQARAASGPVPRGIARSGPAILSYGFRPFFLLAGIWGLGAMAAWIATLVLGLPLGGSYGALHWHAHEMLFGYTSAALAGFMLTAIPNWTGRLPVSGLPLAFLASLWIAGRVAMGVPDVVGLPVAIVIESLFLPTLAAIAVREVGTARNWRNLHVVIGLGLLTTANVWFHLSAVGDGDTANAHRLAISIWMLLIMLIGGRLTVSFTTNWLSLRSEKALPASFGRFDRFTILFGLMALACWVALPESRLTAAFCLAAALVHFTRAARWRGWTAVAEPLVAILHVAYLFIPLGLLAIAASTIGWIGETSALHVLTVGVIGAMTLAVMSRATRGHTGNPLEASGLTTTLYGCIIISALVRPIAEFLPDQYLIVLAVSAMLWMAAFGLFLVEYGPMLVRPRRVRREG